MAKRLVRAKRKIRESGIPFELPPDGRARRLPDVLRVVYLMFTEGHRSRRGPDLVDTEFCDRAIKLARTLGIPLKIAAKVDKVDEVYFREQIAPLINQPDVEYIGEINESAKTEFLGEALALLFPIDWPEPFGLAMIEAMACGTPVLAFRHGSVPEVIDEGVTGMTVDSMDEAVRKLPHVLALDRRAVRRRFDQRFTATRMAKDYVQTYRALLQGVQTPSMQEVVPRLQPALEETLE